MSRIRGKDTKPEITLRKLLWSMGLRYRIHHGVTGRPDIVFPSARIAVFVDGCFWHGCPEHRVKPKSNQEFWYNKLKRNRARDKKVNRVLGKDGWVVIRVWEHEIKDSPAQSARKIKRTVRRQLK